MRHGSVPGQAGSDKSSCFTITRTGDYTVIDFLNASMMDVQELARAQKALEKMVDEQDRRRMVLNFERVQFLSSQTIGILISLSSRIKKLKGGRLIVVGVGERMAELLKITRLDKVLEIKRIGETWK